MSRHLLQPFEAGRRKPARYEISMLAKPILFALIAACGVYSGAAAASPDEKQPPEESPEDQHFCCTSVDAKNFSGEGCGAISKENINACSKVLYCPGAWVKDDGKVNCSV